MKTVFRLLLLVLSVSLCVTIPLRAQWLRTSLDNGAVTCFAVADSNLLAGTWGNGIFLSTDDGTSWTALDSGLTDTCVNALVVSGTSQFAGTSSGSVFRSTNNGKIWTPVDSGLTNTSVSAFGASGTNLFAATADCPWQCFGGVFLSTNNGTSWTALDSGPTNTAVNALAVNGTNLFAGAYNGVFLSTNNGTSWTAMDSGLKDTLVNDLVVSGTNLFAGTFEGVFLSTNNGTAWTVASSGLPYDSATQQFAHVRCFAANGTNLFAGFFGAGVFLSTNNGTNWTAVNSGLADMRVWTLVVSRTNLFVGTWGGGVWKRPLSEMITSVGSQFGDFPVQISLTQNYPNPFNPSTKIGYRVQGTGDRVVTLKVYDILGREVATLVNERKAPGSYGVKFEGSGLSSGVYFYRLNVGQFVESRKMILMK